MYVYQAIVDALVKEGVAAVFAVGAHDNLDILVELSAKTRIKVINARNERGAAAMADGYARVTGEPGIFTVTHGPGLGNIGTAMITAARNRTPVMCITADRPNAERTVFGKAWDQALFAESTAGKYLRVRSIDSLDEDIHAAFRYLRSGNGPLVFSVPFDLITGRKHFKFNYVPAIFPEQQRLYPDPGAVGRAATLISQSKKTGIIAGRGAFDAGVTAEITAMAENTRAILATSVHAKSYLSDHPYNVGTIGGFSSPAARELLAACDCIITVGCTLAPQATRFGKMFPNAKIIQIDREAGHIGYFIPVAEGIVGDARACLVALTAALPDRKTRDTGWWTPRVKTKIAASRAGNAVSYEKVRGRLDPRQVITEIDKILPKNRIVSVDNGAFNPFVIDGISVPDPIGMLPTWAFSSVGLALYEGIGAAVARPDRHVVAFMGDGGFMMSLEELETAARYRIPMTVVILNDNAYGMEVHLMRAEKKQSEVPFFNNPDFARVAESLGASGVTVHRISELKSLSGKFGKGNRPLLVNIMVNGDVVHEMVGTLMAGEEIHRAEHPFQDK